MNMRIPPLSEERNIPHEALNQVAQHFINDLLSEGLSGSDILFIASRLTFAGTYVAVSRSLDHIVSNGNENLAAYIEEQIKKRKAEETELLQKMQQIRDMQRNIPIIEPEKTGWEGVSRKLRKYWGKI